VRDDPEHELQVSIVTHYRKTYAGLIFAVPNGGWRGRIEAKKLKDEGVLAGVCDLIILQPFGRIFLMEVKAGKGRPSDAQKDFMRDANELGYPTATVWTLAEAKSQFAAWGLVPKPAALRSDLARTTGF
jgi:hypothetical protein